jgi:hypothetical protein
MATRTSNKSASTSSATETVAHEETVGFDINAMLGALGMEVPSGKRVLVSLVAGAFAAGVGVYFGSQVAMYLTFGAALLTGSAFLTFMVNFIATALVVFGSLMAGAWVQKGVLTGEWGFDTSALKAKALGLKDRAVLMFNSTKERVAA